MTRNGKIARLPWKIREELNRRLRDNVPGTKICEWVNGLPACKRVCAEFARRSGSAKSPVTVNQVSEWRRGGFQDWLREQQALEESRELRQWCAKLGRNGGEITEGVATLLSGQLLKLVQGMGELESKVQSPRSKVIRVQSAECGARNVSNADCGLRIAELGNVECPCVETKSAGLDPRTSLRVADPRSGAAEMEGMESAVGLLRELVKCLSGIRRGDHSRVRLAQSEKKLALRSKLVGMELEIYEKEKAKEEELERQKRAAERRRKRSPVSKLDDHGQIDLVRGKLFGPELIVLERERVLAEREKETKRLQKELEILKAEMPESRRSEKESNVQSPMSNVDSKSGTAAQSGVEPIRVDTSAYDQSQGKNIGEKAKESTVQSPSPAAKASTDARAMEDRKSNGLSNGNEDKAPSVQ